MADKKKTVPEQFGQMALGFAEIIASVDKNKGSSGQDREQKQGPSKNIS